MLRNLPISFVFCALLGNIAIGYPDLRMNEETEPKCPDIDTGLATLLPHESDCTAYYMCQSGVAITKECPDNLHFNPKRKVCDFPERAGCQTDTEDPTKREKDSKCPKTDKDTAVLLPHESDCNAYYMCQSGETITRECPHDLHFNPKKNFCDFPEEAGCQTDSELRTKRKNQPECPDIDKGLATLLPHESDCTAYYMCQSGVAITKECPDNLHFNPKRKVCDFPERAGCQTAELPTLLLAEPEATGSPSPFCPVINGEYPVFFPHPTNCSIYYMCGNGLAYEKTCPSRLHFNVRLKVCDYPWRANCQK